MVRGKVVTTPTAELIKPLTSARFFAASAVVLFHSGASWASDNPSIPAPIRTLLLNGYLGVTFFFVLSGFVLHLTYRERKSIGKFWAARLARIYPVYLLAVLAMLPFVALSGLADVPQFLLLHAWLPGMGNWNMPTWTLSVELFFYLCFPWICGAARRLSRGGLGLIIVGALMFDLATNASSLADVRSAPFAWMTSVPLPLLRLPEFVIGIAVAELHCRGNRLPVPAWALAAALLLGLALTNAYGIAAFATAMSAALIMGLAGEGGSWLSRALSIRWLVLLGGSSYALYLLHQPIHFGVVALLGSAKAVVALQYPVMLGLSVGVFLLYEEPARERIRALFGRKPSAIARVVSGEV